MEICVVSGRNRALGLYLSYRNFIVKPKIRDWFIQTCVSSPFRLKKRLINVPVRLALHRGDHVSGHFELEQKYVLSIIISHLITFTFSYRFRPYFHERLAEVGKRQNLAQDAHGVSEIKASILGSSSVDSWLFCTQSRQFD